MNKIVWSIDTLVRESYVSTRNARVELVQRTILVLRHPVCAMKVGSFFSSVFLHDCPFEFPQSVLMDICKCYFFCTSLSVSVAFLYILVFLLVRLTILCELKDNNRI